MSDALAAEFQCRAPIVLYNAFEWSGRRSIDCVRKDRTTRQRPSIHWYSQTLGYGRGLEDLLTALPTVRFEAEIHLRGKPIPGFEQWLMSNVPDHWRKNIFLHTLVTNDELLSRIAEHDIGFAGEMKYCRSRDLTVTNKILHYMLAGLATVASDTSGQQEVARLAKGAVQLYSSGNAAELAGILNLLLASVDRLGAAKEAALDAAEHTFNWENQIPKLVSSVELAMSNPNN
jgi:hypothetical protein